MFEYGFSGRFINVSLRIMIKHILVIVIGVFFSSCIKFPTPCFRELLFEFPVSLTGVNDTLMVDSAITISSEIPDILMDLNSEELFDFREIPIINSMLIMRINETSHEYVPEYIDIISKQGDYEIRAYEDLTIASSIGYEYVLDYVDTLETRNFECIIRIKDPGLYIIYFNSFYLDLDPNLDPDCQEILRHNYIRLNNGIALENNYQMINEVSESQRLDWIKEENNYRNAGGYTLFVK